MKEELIHEGRAYEKEASRQLTRAQLAELKSLAELPDDAIGTSNQAAARFGRRGAFPGGGRRRSAGTRKRARSLCTIPMLSPLLPRETSLTRLGVPRMGTMSARVSPC